MHGAAALAGAAQPPLGADGVAPRRQRFPQGAPRRELRLEARPERARPSLHAPRPDDQPRDVVTPKDAMHPSGEGPMDAIRVVGGACRARTEALERVVELVTYGLHVAERN